MINPKRLLLTVARKWQKRLSNKRKRISIPRQKFESLCAAPVAKQGHFVVYTMDDKRFEFPLVYLRSNIFVQLFRRSEIEFGLPTDGPITLPCESALFEYVVSFVKEGPVGEELQNTLVSTFCLELGQSHNQMIILGF